MSLKAFPSALTSSEKKKFPSMHTVEKEYEDMADRDAGLEDGSDVATSQATQTATRSWKRQGTGYASDSGGSMTLVTP